MDWADKFIHGVYQPLFSNTFLFQGLLVGELFLCEYEELFKVRITRDYINWEAWVNE